MIDLLIGSDIYAIQKKVAFFKTKLDKTWAMCNYHKFDGIDIEKAICCAITPAFGITGLKLVVVENCDFKQIAPETFSALQSITKLTDTRLVLLGTSVDKRLKAVKLLLKCANLFECDLLPPWRTDLIASKISSEAIHLKLELNNEIVQYLAVAIGNNLTRAESELRKLLTYRAGKRLSLVEVRMLIPSSTQSSLQLAEAIRTGKAKQAASLLGELLAMNNHPMMICATLITQFRTWLWIKSAIQSGVKQDTEIAKTCNIGNPKRVYFLKQEVQHTSLAALKYAVKMLFDLEISLKTGYQSSHLLLSILSVTRLFSS